MILIKNKTKRHICRGFSFLEVIISIFVLSVGFLGVIQLATTTLGQSFLQRDAVIASMLAQEGVELVHNIRYTNLAKGDPAFTNITAGDHRISATNNPPALGSGSYQLSLNSNGEYGYSGATPTKFHRKIIISGAGATRNVTSIVSGRLVEGVFPAANEANCNMLSRCVFVRAQLQEE